MTRGQIGLAIYAAGVAVFVVGLTGFAQAFTTYASYASMLGVLVIFAGSIILLRTLTLRSFSWPHRLVVFVTLLAIALHVYENLFKSSGSFSLGWVLWAMMPYGVCLAVSANPDTRTAAVAGVVVTFIIDLLTHYDVFMHPTGSTAALALIWIPLWNTLIFAPLAILFASLILRRRPSPIHHAP